MVETVFASFGDGRTGWKNAVKRIVSEAQKLGLFSDIHLFDNQMIEKIDPQISELRRVIINRCGPRGNGYWVWKTAILDWLAERYPSKQILYVDAGSHLDSNPAFSNTWIAILNQAVARKGLAWSLPGFLESEWTKSELFTEIDPLRTFGMTDQVQSGFIGLPPSDLRLTFTKEYRSLALKDDGFLFTDELRDHQLQTFIEHRHDQSVLSLLWKKYNFGSLSDRTDPGNLGSYPVIAMRNNTGVNAKYGSRILQARRYVDLCIDTLRKSTQ